MIEPDGKPPEWSLRAEGIVVSTSAAGGVVTVHPDMEGAVAPDPASQGADERAGAVRIGEFLGAPHSPLSGHTWEIRQEQPGTVTLATAWRSLMIEKQVSVTAGGGVRLDYAYLNAGAILVRPAFGLRVEVAARPGMRWSVPAVGGLRHGGPDDVGAVRRYLRPEEPWCAVDRDGEGIAALFPPGVLDAVEVWLDGPRGVFSLTPLIYYIGLSPGAEARVSCLVARTSPAPDGASRLQDRYGDGLTASYGPAAPERRARAEDLVAAGIERPGAADPGAAEACRILQARAEMLAAGREERLRLIDRLASGKVTIEEALDRLKAGIDLPPHL